MIAVSDTMKIEIAPNAVRALVFKGQFRGSARQRDSHRESAATRQWQVWVRHEQVFAGKVDVCGKKLPTDSGANAMDWQSHDIDEPAADVKNAGGRIPVCGPIIPPAIPLTGGGEVPFLATAP